MTKINAENFTCKVQDILEKYYLQPMDKTNKKILKDGYIERQIHGAMHASRATLWSLILHQWLLTISPDYINGSIKTIAEYIKEDTSTVCFLLCMKKQ